MTVSYLGAAVDTAAVDAVIRDFFAERRAEAEAFGQDFGARVTWEPSFDDTSIDVDDPVFVHIVARVIVAFGDGHAL